VAETFSALSGLFPGRIDLGLGRAPGTDPMTMFALQRDRRSASPDDFIEQLTELLGYLNGDLAADHPFSRLSATLPGLPEGPEPWLLGSSPQSAVWAGQLGLRYAFADFINAKGAEIADLYRREFRDTADLPGPTVAVATWAICAETQEEADRLASSSRMTLRLLNQGRLIPVPPVETAMRFLASQPESSDPKQRRRRAIIGGPDTVREGIEAVARDYGAQEVMVVTITHDHEARRRSYELIAESFGLGAAITAQNDRIGYR
jgi:luciferase family oxidoreductase group 1